MQTELAATLHTGDKNVKSELALELQAALSIVNTEHEKSLSRILMEFNESNQDWIRRFGASAKELNDYKQEVCMNLEEMEERTEKKWDGIRQVLSSAICARRPYADCVLVFRRCMCLGRR